MRECKYEHTHTLLRETRNEVSGSRCGCFQVVKTEFVKVECCTEGTFLVENRERECHWIVVVVERFDIPESDLSECKFRRALLVALKSLQQIVLLPLSRDVSKICCVSVLGPDVFL